MPCLLFLTSITSGHMKHDLEYLTPYFFFYSSLPMISAEVVTIEQPGTPVRSFAIQIGYSHNTYVGGSRQIRYFGRITLFYIHTAMHMVAEQPTPTESNHKRALFLVTPSPFLSCQF
jgi:hypothetical protein